MTMIMFRLLALESKPEGVFPESVPRPLCPSVCLCVCDVPKKGIFLLLPKNVKINDFGPPHQKKSHTLTKNSHCVVLRRLLVKELILNSALQSHKISGFGSPPKKFVWPHRGRFCEKLISRCLLKVSKKNKKKKWTGGALSVWVGGGGGVEHKVDAYFFMVAGFKHFPLVLNR